MNIQMGFQQKLKLVSVNTYPRKIYMKKSNGLQQKLKFVSTNKKKKITCKCRAFRLSSWNAPLIISLSSSKFQKKKKKKTKTIKKKNHKNLRSTLNWKRKEKRRKIHTLSRKVEDFVGWARAEEDWLGSWVTLFFWCEGLLLFWDLRGLFLFRFLLCVLSSSIASQA